MTENLDIKQMVGGGKQCELCSIRAGVLTYRTCTGFRFRVPCQELGDAEVRPIESAMALMRWIRRAIQEVQEVPVVSCEVCGLVGGESVGCLHNIVYK
jgi:hypothetical protein